MSFRAKELVGVCTVLLFTKPYLAFLSWKSERFQTLHRDSAGSIGISNSPTRKSSFRGPQAWRRAGAVWEKTERPREIGNVASGWVIGERPDWVMFNWSCERMTSWRNTKTLASKVKYCSTKQTTLHATLS